MKNLILFTSITLSCCSGLDKNGLKKVLQGNSFEWHISAHDTSVYQTHFFKDSVYLLVFKDDQDTSHSQVGYWSIKNDLFHTKLRFTNHIEDGEITLRSYRDDILSFSSYKDNRFQTVNKQYRYKAIKMNETTESNLTPLLLGSWHDPADSILGSFLQHTETGKVMVNPTFRFTKDSFDIQTEFYREKGTYRIASFGHDVILLESIRYSNNNGDAHMTVEIDYIDSTELRLRLDKKYRLRRDGP
ncbi:MAG TPA: hypothetical protein VD884_12655 [Ohtaekwangia sp.]|nr:hypothetical protein [Ohtaekwangia sp.]